ncbi:peroxiredoxin family protein [Desulfovibrio ferrophilus]|uniref:Putative Redoxin domain protein n=1 Tax=Desulfovibrio ferrophilus TaxID=241368 RepID=A0A2Z6AVT1_9BACT|nr:TlpA disulfide reductase family protein [Desulfovibrio ferrophilus]BBD07347.1 putative Redoxin domain protein [Desulfovibrio ferrophilus]
MRRAISLAVFLVLFAGSAGAMNLPEPGTTLPRFAIPMPPLESDQVYLGVHGDSFALSDISADVIILEFSGVYCPICHQQAPDVRKLFKRIQRAGLGDRVKLFSVAGGATQMEVDHVRQQYNAVYPIIRDPDFAVHKVLGEPKTPYTMLLKSDGTVLWAHLGKIADFGEFYTIIQSFL